MSRDTRGTARCRIVRATAVSNRPGWAFALMPRDPSHMNVTTAKITINATSNRTAFRTGFTIHFPRFFKYAAGSFTNSSRSAAEQK